MRIPWLCAVMLLLSLRVARAEVYRHDLFGVSFKVPAGFSGNADVARSRDAVLSAWNGRIDKEYALLIIEHVDAVATDTKDDEAARRVVDVALIGARSDATERETVRWHKRTLTVIVGLVKGDVYREAHAVVDVPLADGSALRIRLSTAATRRAGLRRALGALVATLAVRKATAR